MDTIYFTIFSQLFKIPSCECYAIIFTWTHH